MFTTSAPVVGVHAPSGAPTAPRGPRPGRPAAPSDPRPEPTTTRQPAGSYNQPPPTPPQATGHRQTRLVGLGRSPGRLDRPRTHRGTGTEPEDECGMLTVFSEVSAAGRPGSASARDHALTRGRLT